MSAKETENMTTEQRLEALEYKTIQLTKRIRVVLVVAIAPLLMVIGHFTLHALGRL